MHSGRSPGVHDRATQLVVAGSAHVPFVKGTPMNTHSYSRALVLGGGGAAGNAWLIGVIAGLFEAGLDARTADLIIGTSAGATAAAQITGASPTTLLADILDAPPSPAGVSLARPVGVSLARPVCADSLREFTDLIAQSSDLADMRRRLGARGVALSAAAEGTVHARWHDIVATRLPSADWPDQLIRLTVVDAETGEPVELDRESGVPLVDAVAASTSNAHAYRIGERSYLDGGYRRSSENADLAAGYDRVLVLSPLGGRTLHPAEWGSDLATQVAELTASGSTVETVLPDTAALAAFGGNMMNPATRIPAARAGADQGRALAAQLAAFWN
jgi:NTE family protein